MDRRRSHAERLTGVVYERVRTSPETMLVLAESCWKIAKLCTDESDRDAYLGAWTRYTLMSVVLRCRAVSQPNSGADSRHTKSA